MSAAPAIQMPVLTTARLAIRGLELDDAPIWEAMCAPLEVAQNTLTMPHPYPPGGAAQFIERCHASQARGEGATFAITLKDARGTAGPLVGTMGLNIVPAHQHAEFGYALGMDHWGRGYATEAGRAVVDWSFEALGLERLNAGFYTRNPASGRVLEKLGFVREGLRPRMYQRFGEWVDVTLVGLLRTTWHAARGGAPAR